MRFLNIIPMLLTLMVCTNGAGADSGDMVFVKQGGGGFWMDKYLVTQEGYERDIGSNPSGLKGCPVCPVESVSWYEADTYCKKAGKRLPTTAEWEFAARSGGTGEIWPGTSNERELEEYAWYGENSAGKTHPVGEKKPNKLGLYDMSGNVWEWTDSWYDSSQKSRIIRGGSWRANAFFLRTALRDNSSAPVDRGNVIGFRCARDGNGVLIEVSTPGANEVERGQVDNNPSQQVSKYKDEDLLALAVIGGVGYKFFVEPFLDGLKYRPDSASSGGSYSGSANSNANCGYKFNEEPHKVGASGVAGCNKGIFEDKDFCEEATVTCLGSNVGGYHTISAKNGRWYYGNFDTSGGSLDRAARHECGCD